MILNPRYWGKTAAGVLPLCVKTGRVLLTLRSQQVMEPGTWGIPGGRIMDGSTKRNRETGELFVEPVETPAEGALREFREETFYTGDVELVPLYVYKDRLQGFFFYNFLGLVKSEFSEKRVGQSWEVEIARWMTLDTALEVEPKHFGLRSLLLDLASLETIMSYTIIENPPKRCEWRDGAKVKKFANMQGFRVWIVDGGYVRSVIGEVEFNLGGHHWRYPFIPHQEIWVEDTGNFMDVYANVMHELIEVQAMRVDGLDYDTAHKIASSHEAAIRQSILEMFEDR